MSTHPSILAWEIPWTEKLPLLEQLLPALKYCLHDNSEKVRVAFVDMLLKVKAVRAAKVR